MSKVADVGQQIMDMYYRDFPTDEDFFKLIHFTYIAGIVYGWLLEQDYKEQRNISRQENGFTQIHLSPECIVTESAEVSHDKEMGLYKAKPKYKPYTFSAFDEYGYGIQDVQTNSGDFLRISYRSKWKFKKNPPSDKTFWFNQSGDVYLDASAVRFKKVNLLYLPNVLDEAYGEDGGEIPTNKEYAVVSMGLDAMRKAREGSVIDMTNNSNPNSALSTEISTTFDKLKNKPI